MLILKYQHTGFFVVAARILLETTLYKCAILSHVAVLTYRLLTNPKQTHTLHIRLTIRSDQFFFLGTVILHLFGALRDRNTQTKYFKSEVEVETMHLSSQTRGSISHSAHTGTDSPLCPTFHSTHVAIFKMTPFAAEANDRLQVCYSLSVHTPL